MATESAPDSDLIGTDSEIRDKTIGVTMGFLIRWVNGLYEAFGEVSSIPKLLRITRRGTLPGGPNLMRQALR